MAILNNNDEARKTLKDEIAKLKSVNNGIVKDQLPSTTLDFIEYAAPSDSALAEQAESGLSGYRTENEKALKEKAENEKAALGSAREEYVSGLESGKTELESSFNAAKQNVDNDVLKRGLARSTIAVNAKTDVEKQYLQSAAALAKEYGAKIDDIDAQLSGLSSKYETALNDFNLSYAAKLADKITELKSERAKKQEEVLKYNNDVKQKQAELDIARKKAESDLYSEKIDQNDKLSDLDNLSAEQRAKVYEAVYDKMDTFLSGMSGSDAKREFLNHSFYRENLSDYYYYKLYDKYGR